MHTRPENIFQPEVSIVVPCFNEECTIKLLLQAILNQTYPLLEIEVVIADAFSTDQTRKTINNFAKEHPDLVIKVVDNPERTIPAAINEAVKFSRGIYIIRLDAHSVPSPNYVERCVDAISSNKGNVVGGVWDIKAGSKNWIAKSIAAAAAHPLGVGDALYRYTNQSGVVDTVPFGAFRKDLFIKVGGFDPTLLTNEDYEFYTRVRKSGGIVWLDPKIRCIYFSRSSLSDLARQYWRYGFWKFRMLIRYPHTLRWRQALPPLFVLTILGLGITSIFFPSIRILLIMVLGLYLVSLMMASVAEAIKRHIFSLFLGMPLAMAVMHVSWGAGLIYSMIARKIFGK